MTNEAGHSPLPGLGYTFDATLGYPGEGPSHHPPHSAAVDSLRIRLDFEHNLPKTTFGNSDTRLGQWLHASRHQAMTDATTRVTFSNTGFRRRHRQDSRHRTTAAGGHSGTEAPVAPGAEATDTFPSTATGQCFSTTVAAQEARAPSELQNPLPRPIPRRTITQVDAPLNRIPKYALSSSLSNPSIDVGAPSSVRREFIRKFAQQHGVSLSRLDAIWRSNKHGYNVAYDAPFARFPSSFGRLNPKAFSLRSTYCPGTWSRFYNTSATPALILCVPERRVRLYFYGLP
jgi:hypothetical protein